MDFSATDESGSHTHDVSIAEQGSSGDHSPPCLPPTSSFMLEITFFLISYLGAGVACQPDPHALILMGRLDTVTSRDWLAVARLSGHSYLHGCLAGS
jgi:hypothetical protein